MFSMFLCLLDLKAKFFKLYCYCLHVNYKNMHFCDMHIMCSVYMHEYLTSKKNNYRLGFSNCASSDMTVAHEKSLDGFGEWHKNHLVQIMTCIDNGFDL